MFKKLKYKLRLAIGAIGAALMIGGASAYWIAERKGFENNITVYDKVLGPSVFIGDVGETTEARDILINQIKSGWRTENIFLLGDLGYPDGVKNLKEFTKWVRPYLPLADKVHCILGNHDSYASNEKERGWLALNADKNGCVFGNYYKGLSYSDWCIGIIDSAIYDTLKDHEMQDRQEQFIKRFFNSHFCENKKTMLLNHHTVYTYGSHMRDGNRDHNNFIKGLNVDYVISGHDHLLAQTTVGKTTYIVSGAGAKLDECKEKKGINCWEKNGYFEYFNGEFERVEIK